MITNDDHRPYAGFLMMYQDLVSSVHPEHLEMWPLFNGWNISETDFDGWEIVVFRDDPYNGLTRATGMKNPSQSVIGYPSITQDNVRDVRSRLERYYNIGPRDGVALIPPDRNVYYELQALLQRHEASLGIGAMKIFLSHKGVNKEKVREFKQILQLLGFDPWIDEDAMPAGTTLDRGILGGFQSSCAVVFFITPEFLDEGYLSDEINYAKSEKRQKGDKFAIITLVFGAGDVKGTVPSLLMPYVWKEPKTDIQALQEIIKALPIKVGGVHWR